MLLETKSDNLIYEERAPSSYVMKIIITLGLAVLALSYFFSVFGHFFGFEKAPEDAQFALLLAALIYSTAMWSFFSMRFRITDESIEAAMPPFKYKIPFSEVNEIKIIEKIPWYIGWGLRFWGRGLAFVSMHKRAVLIERKSGFFWKLILTTQDPDSFVRLVEEKRRHHSGR